MAQDLSPRRMSSQQGRQTVTLQARAARQLPTAIRALRHSSQPPETVSIWGRSPFNWFYSCCVLREHFAVYTPRGQAEHVALLDMYTAICLHTSSHVPKELQHPLPSHDQGVDNRKPTGNLSTVQAPQSEPRVTCSSGIWKGIGFSCEQCTWHRASSPYTRC